MGNLLGTGVMRAFLPIPNEWAWRIPFGIQWLWPLPLFIATYYAPESPWWLVKQNRPQEAEKTLDRIVTAPPGAINNHNTVAMMQHTIELERSLNIGTSYIQCFKGTNLRRTEIAMIAWGCQILPGFSIQSYITYFFTLAGVPAGDAFKLALGNFSLAFIGTVSSWFTQTYFGRRTIYMTGLCFMVPIMWTVGFLELGSNDTTRWVQAGLLMFWFLCYGTTIGPIPYIIAAEVGASQLRVKTICLGRNTYYFLNFINVIAAPYMLNPSEGNLKGKAAFPAAVSTICLLAWAYFRLPEMKQRTPEELDTLFDRKVSARNFKKEGEILARERAVGN